MIRLRLLCAAMTIALLTSGALADGDDAPTASEKLAQAIKLYDAQDYAGAKKLLAEIKDSDLESSDEQIQLGRYVTLTDKALAPKAVAQKPASQAKPVSAKTQHALDQSSLVDQLAHEHQLLWQKAVATYKANETKIRRAVLAENFTEARKLMDFAKSTIELNRRYATPASAYEDYIQQARELEAFIDDEKRVFDEHQIRIQQEEIRARRNDQIRLVEESQRRQIEQLMDQAAELRKERKLDQAIQVLGQVLAIDANNDQAAWMRETLEDLAQNVRDRVAVRERARETQDALIENDETGIPRHEIGLTYPKNWLEITNKRIDVAGVTESKKNQDVRKKLSRVVPEIKFDAVEFSEVIEKLRALTGLNFHPAWAALEALAIEKDAEVTLSVVNVSVEKALKLILEEVGAGEVDLAYEIDDGVISISTKEDLSRRTLTRVYNIKDLLISVPTFRGPAIQIANIGQSGNQQGGLGGGRFIEGGGQGGGGQGQGNFLTDDGNDDEENLDDPVEPIIELIQETIDPESWREAGGNVGSISSLNQQLIVTQTSTAHAQLRDLLREAD